MRQSNQSLRFRRIGFLKCSSTKRRRVWRPCQLLAGLVTAWLILGGIVIAAGLGASVPALHQKPAAFLREQTEE